MELLLTLFLWAGAVMNASESRSIEILVVFDNTVSEQGQKVGVRSGWGFSCLVKTPGKTVLFDTGLDGAVLLANMSQLGLDVASVDLVVLSHEHDDHFGGLWAVLEKKPGLEVVVHDGFSREFDHKVQQAGGKIRRVKNATELAPGLHSTGRIDGVVPEQALIVQTGEGPWLITGCAHPGIVEVSERATRLIGKPPVLVLGGFHLKSTAQDAVRRIAGRLQEMGVKRIGPCHCTGEASIRTMAEVFGEGFVPIGAGTRITSPE